MFMLARSLRVMLRWGLESTVTLHHGRHARVFRERHIIPIGNKIPYRGTEQDSRREKTE
jgi:hypothetical protein